MFAIIRYTENELAVTHVYENRTSALRDWQQNRSSSTLGYRTDIAVYEINNVQDARELLNEEVDEQIREAATELIEEIE